MRWGFAFAVVFVLSGWVQAQGLQLQIVDTESGKPVEGVMVKRWASQWQPRILQPPGKFWFPEKAVATGQDGRITIDKVAGDDWYAVQAEGYEEGKVEKVQGKYSFTARAGGKAQELVVKAGVVILPLKQSDSKPGDRKPK